MTGVLRKLFPVSSSIREDDEGGNDPEYSFAMEYSGPSVTYDIPQVVPVDVDYIPTASIVAPASMLNDLSLPIIQPIVGIDDPLNDKSSNRFKFGSGLSLCRNSEAHLGDLFVSGEIVLSDVHGISCYSVNVIRRSSRSGLTEKILDRTGSSSTLGFSDSRDGSNELSESSEVEGLHDEGKDGWNLSESPRLSADTISPDSEIRPCEEENSIDEPPRHANRIPVVTFRDLESTDSISEKTDHDEMESIQERKVSRANVKKGLCHRCKKRNRFTEKEVCIVCGAKYCANCVLREMGSMPEGRKCITCIGFRIDESKRGTLGKCTRMLKRLLTDVAVKQIMSFEVLCEVNQVPPELVYVNGKPLCHEELALLLGCQNPPKKLKPGRYWYDKVSGFWGEEGEKPCQIISSQLAVGDSIMRNASNGNTKILINNREITKAELRMLRMARINCEGNPHFWVTADGSYQEEGQKNVRGRIWDKTGIKLICSVLDLPIPPESATPCKEEVDNLANSVVPNFLEQKALTKLLLVGYNKSGTSTIFKQAKIVYKVPFSEYEREGIKLVIQSNLYGYLGILLEGRGKFEEEWKQKFLDRPGPSGLSGQIDARNIYSISPRLKAFSDWLLQVMAAGNLEVIFPAATREYAPFVEELWKDRSFQATYSRRRELHLLPRVATHFLDRAVEISRTDYEPSDTDILYSEGITSSNGLACMEFSFPNSTQDNFSEPTDQNDPLLWYQLIRVHASSLGKNCKWLEMFEDVNLVLYSVALTDFDQYYDDSNGISTNKMLESKKLFESIITNPTFYQKDFLLLLNKFDLLEEKIEHVPLTVCDWFHDFNPVISANPDNCNSSSTNASLAQRTFHYIATKFKRLFYSHTGRKLYVSRVSGLESVSVDRALRYGREILKWDEENLIFNGDRLSSSSIEESSTL